MRTDKQERSPSAKLLSMGAACDTNPVEAEAVQSLLLQARARSPSPSRLTVSEQFARKVNAELQPPSRRTSVRESGAEFTLNKLNLSEIEMVGREDEVLELQRIFDGVNDATLGNPQGDMEVETNGPRFPTLVSIAGFSGTGKTVLAQSLRPLVQSCGFFCTGKFDLQQRAEPYTGFIQALSDLTEQILRKDENFVADISKRVKEAVGGEAQVRVLTDVVPSLTRLFGEAETDASEGSVRMRANRLQFVFRQFTRSLCAQGQPLVMVLDDLQWVDAPSLRLLEALITDVENPSFMVVTTSRDNETDNEHPFVQSLNELDGGGVNVHRITVGNLDSSSVCEMVATALRSSVDVAKPLSDIIHRKTHGNAFFALQFLKSLVDENLLTYSFGLMKWNWRLQEIQAIQVTENVRGLMMEKLEKLPREACAMLQAASCLGQSFEVELLESVIEKVQLSNIFEDMESLERVSVNEGLLLLVDEGLLVLSGSRYSFVHDQIQSAANNQIPENKRLLLQLRIGEQVLEEATDKDLDNLFFLAVELFNPSMSLLGKIEKHGLARYNLLAGNKAMKKSAFVPGGKYMESGLACLGGDAWSSDHYKLTLNLSIGAAEAAYAVGDFDKLQRHMDCVIDAGGPFEDKIRVYLTRIVSLGVQELFVDAVSTGLFVLKEMGMASFPMFPSRLTAMRELVKTKRLLKNFTQETLSTLPALADEKRIQAMGIIYILSTMTYVASPNLHLIVYLKAVRWSVKYGVSKYSPFFFATYGMILGGVLGDTKQAFMFGEVALALDDRLDARDTSAKTISTVYGYVAHWTSSLHSTLKPCLFGHQIGMACGEVEMAMHSLLLHDLALVLTASRPLPTLVSEIEAHVHHMREYKQDAFANFSVLFLQAICNLSGQSDNPVVMTGRAMNEEQVAKHAAENKNRVMEVMLYSFRMQLAYLFGDYVSAGKYAENSLDFGTKAAPGFMLVPCHYFYRGLTASALAGLGHDSRKNLRCTIQILKTMKKWSSNGNGNCLHMVKLLEAEVAVLEKKDVASELYKEAIQTASRSGFLQDKSLGHYRAGLYHLVSDTDSYWAAFHFDQAIQGYRAWGAKAMVNYILQNYGHVVRGVRQEYNEQNK